MKLKKYLVKDIKEALIKVRQELGEDAVILSTRKVRRGAFLGLFGGEVFIEVTAAGEENYERKRRTPPKHVPTPPSMTPHQTSMSPKENNASMAMNMYQLKEILSKNTSMEKSKPAVQDTTKDSLEEIKTMISDLKRTILTRKESRFPPPYDILAEYLKMQDMSDKTVENIVEAMMVSCGKDTDLDAGFWKKLKEYIAKLVLVQIPQPSGRIIFVGPTGVGKTTTLAKLAAKYYLEDNHKVMIASVDTFRIGAAEQLKTYAELMGLPFAVAYTPKELRLILEGTEEYDVVLIDTAGRNPWSELNMRELKAFVESANMDSIMLVVSATTRLNDLKDTIERFKSLTPTHLIFTKLDETRTHGSIPEIIAESGLPLAFITDGQRVPDDIRVPDPEDIASKIVERVRSLEEGSSNFIT
ncbi:MAG: flagellar biosynthesis protein FlhF [Thermotogae bacterium]|nr:flagellar biosynthesis protein FlhF [Thermotogota bacterium]